MAAVLEEPRGAAGHEHGPCHAGSGEGLDAKAAFQPVSMRSCSTMRVWKEADWAYPSSVPKSRR